LPAKALLMPDESIALRGTELHGVQDRPKLDVITENRRSWRPGDVAHPSTIEQTFLVEVGREVFDWTLWQPWIVPEECRAAIAKSDSDDGGPATAGKGSRDRDQSCAGGSS
jgi:hypothetical protein